MRTQLSLLEEPATPTRTEPPIFYTSDFLTPSLADRFFRWSDELDWKRNQISMYGKPVEMPRDEIMLGPSGTSYAYNGLTLNARSMPDFIKDLRERIEYLTEHKFTIAIGNRYHNGKDSIGWHADDSPEIGLMPAIASISLGATRRFKLRHNATKEIFDYELASGSLLVMRPGCQEEWQHCIPKTAKPVGARINWTFRPYAGAIA